MSAPEIASVGTRFKATDEWACQCGTVHNFSTYAAAHWTDELTHTCNTCSATRTFQEGEVIE